MDIASYLFRTTLQCVCLLVAARACAHVARRLGQPPVMGELMAGIALGPSLFGSLFPGYFDALFPRDGLAGLKILSEAVLMLFLFQAGLDIELSRLSRIGRPAAAASVLGLLLPFAAGYLLAGRFSAGLIGPAADETIFALFIGTAMSITAIPVITRILMDLDLLRTDVGTTVIGAAVIDDAAGWTMLAALSRQVGSSKGVGIHAGFAVLAAGALLNAWPRAAKQCRDGIGPAARFLSPVFFASAGIAVDVTSFPGLAIPALFVAVACVSKIVGCSAGARLGGMGGWEALAVGFGMNARGAMELVVAAIGLRLGILNTASYSIVVLVALVTTFMTPALLTLALGRNRARPASTVYSGI